MGTGKLEAFKFGFYVIVPVFMAGMWFHEPTKAKLIERAGVAKDPAGRLPATPYNVTFRNAKKGDAEGAAEVLEAASKKNSF
mmetsp:Transcript_14442/g.45415  ORF Transcript_14442/g.45415 Transcript_14442/m.45415 type:complete len:82 (+) Transcript_14442:57-302(+)